VTSDGAPGPNGSGGYKAKPDRYHLYVSLSHRTIIFLTLKGLSRIISVSIVHWLMGADGWTFAEGPGVVADPIVGARRLYDIYKAANLFGSGHGATFMG